MPTPHSIQLPKSRSAEEFEYLCSDVLKDKLSIEFKLYGRSGQAQHGIDLFAESNSALGKYVIAQCKNYFGETKSSELIRKIKDDIRSASQQTSFMIEKFFAMTSYNRDCSIQNELAKLRHQYIFPIDIMFWEDIQVVIANNPQLLHKYYPLYNNQPTVASLFNLVYFGAQLASLMELMLGDRGETARYCDFLENGSCWITNANTRTQFDMYLQGIRSTVMGDIPWEWSTNSLHNTDLYCWCQEVEKIIISLSGYLSREVQPYYTVARHLAEFTKREGEGFTLVHKEHFMKLCQDILLPKDCLQKISVCCDQMLPSPMSEHNILSDYTASTAKINAPFSIYDIIFNHLTMIRA